MARDHTRVNLDIWGDDDFRELPVDAQALYWQLWTSPDRTYCGGHWWHPGKLAMFAGDWTIPRVESAGSVLSQRLFLIIDADVDECLIRSWIKHDGLWKSPNMAVSMAAARAAMTSKACRGVIVHEVKKLATANPDLKSWGRDQVANLLDQRPIDPTTVEPLTPALTPAVTPPLTPHLTPHLRVNPNPPLNPPSNPPSTTATSTSTATTGGYVRSNSHQGDNLPTPHCQSHPNGTERPCRACGDAKDLRAAAVKQRREDEAHRQREAAHQAAALKAQAIANCDLCRDNDGYRNGVVCNHNPTQGQTNARGLELARAALKRTPTDNDTQEANHE